MKIRIGNDFKTKWAITWLGEAEDFSDATDIALFFNIYDKKIELTKDVDYTITDNIIEIDVTPDICNILGIYNLELHYTKPNDNFIDGERRSAVDIDAFRIVGKSEKADATQDVSIISDAVAIFLDIAYKKLEEIEANEGVRIASENERKDTEDVRVANEGEREDAEDIRIENENIRISNEQDRQINTTTAIGNAEQAALNANNSATYADEQGAYAEEMSSHPPTIINDYWHIWNFTTNQYESTGQYARGDSAVEGALVVQTTGQSAVNTMSQKAVTDELAQLAGDLSGYAKVGYVDQGLNEVVSGTIAEGEINSVSGHKIAKAMVGVDKSAKLPELSGLSGLSINLYESTTCRHKESLLWIEYNGSDNIDSLAIFRDGNELSTITIIKNGVSKNYSAAGVRIKENTYMCDDFILTIDASFFTQRSNNYDDCYVYLPLLSNEFTAIIQSADYFRNNYGYSLAACFTNNYIDPFFTDKAKMESYQNSVSLEDVRGNVNNIGVHGHIYDIEFESIDGLQTWKIFGHLYSNMINIRNAKCLIGKFLYIGFFYKSTSNINFAIYNKYNKYHHDGGGRLLYKSLPISNNLSYTYSCVKINSVAAEDIISINLNLPVDNTANITGLKILVLDRDISSLVRPTNELDIISPLEVPVTVYDELRVNNLTGNADLQMLSLAPSGMLPSNKVGFYYNGTDIILQIKDKSYTLNKEEI